MANGRVEVLKKDQVVDLFTTPLECAIFSASASTSSSMYLYVIHMYSYVIRMSLVCHSYITRMSFICHSYVLVCTRMSPYVLVCYPYVFVCHPYVTRMYSYVIRMSLVCTRMSSVCHSYVLVCHSYVLVCHSYVTRLWFYHEPLPNVSISYNSVVVYFYLYFQQEIKFWLIH